MRGQSPWTEATITELTQLWSEGHSGAEIGRRLNVSKNSVIGKARRLDLPGRPSPIRCSEREREQRTKCPSGRFVSLLNLLASGLERLESTVILSLAPIREVPHVDDRKPSPVRPGQAALPK